MNGAIGTVPPSVRSRTGGDRTFASIDATTSRASGSAGDVRKALVTVSDTAIRAIFPCARPHAVVGSPSTR